MAQLKILALSKNQIGDAGLTSFAEACASGAMANLKYLDLDGNPASDAAQQAAKDAVNNRK